MMIAVAAVSVVAAVGWKGSAQPPAAKAAASARRFVWLDQNWAEPVRSRFHHESQGTATLPFPRPWILAIEQRDGTGMFTDADYLERYGFIPSPRSEGSNPDGLPIGFARTSGIDPVKNVPFDSLGFTCAACHTARLDHNETSILVDGGPALINLADFGTDLALSLASSLKRDRFRAFAARVLGPQAPKRERVQLYERVLASLLHEAGGLIKGKIRGVFEHEPKSVEEGFGRLDALNRIGNTVFGDIDSRNVRPQTAPVAFPHIWDTHWFQWVQYNGSIEQPMVRNAGEAMGVGAIVNYLGTRTPRFTSSIPFRELDQWVEQPLRGPVQPQQNRDFTGLRSPPWPSDILGPINRQLAAEGARLYVENCQSCHLPAPNTPAFWADRHWRAPNAAGERYLDLQMVGITESIDGLPPVGTDPAQAHDMAVRTVRVPLDLGVTSGFVRRDGRFGIYRYGFALGDVVAATVRRWYDANNIPQAERDRMNGQRPNGIQAPMAYKARPLNGIWATPPYLHNGAVRTLFDLLSPTRPNSFHLGTNQYDVENVGFMDGGGFELFSFRRKNANSPLLPVPGNLNSGHWFDNDRSRPGVIGRLLSEPERRALIEYLKTL